LIDNEFVVRYRCFPGAAPVPFVVPGRVFYGALPALLGCFLKKVQWLYFLTN
jgi:uncharacterized membrane protein